MAGTRKGAASTKKAGAEKADAGAKKAASKKAAPKKAAPEKAAPRKAAPRKAASRKAGAEGAGGKAVAVVEEVLTAAGWGYERGEEEGWTTFHTPVDEGALATAAVRVSEDLERFMLYLVFQPRAPRGRRTEVAEFVTRANEWLGDGNFELSYDTGEVRFKVAVDFSGVDLPPLLVRNAILDALDVTEVYEEALAAVLAGKLGAKEAIQSAEQKLA